VIASRHAVTNGCAIASVPRFVRYLAAAARIVACTPRRRQVSSSFEGATMTLHRTLAIACAIAVLPAVASAQKTTYDFDKSAPFAQFTSYTMRDGTPTKNPLIDKRIVAAIEAQLAKKGFVRNDVAPDVVVLFHVAFDEQKDISSFSSGPMYGGYGYGWGGGWGTTTTDVRVRDILVGTIAIDMVDAKKKEMVWRGLGTKEINTTAKPEKRDENINKAVEKIFKNYPPKVKA
jgi:hypothetical protein